MPFGIIGSRDEAGEGLFFGGEFGARHCNQFDLYGIDVRQRCDVAVFPNYFEGFVDCGRDTVILCFISLIAEQTETHD